MRSIASALLLSGILSAQTKTPVAAKVAAETHEVTADAAGTVKLTVAQLIALGQSDTFAKLSNQDFPAVTAFRIKRLIDAVTPEITRATKARLDLFTDKNSDLKESGVRIIKADKMEEFLKQQTPLMAEVVTITAAPLSMENDLTGAKFSARDIEALGPLLRSDSK